MGRKKQLIQKCEDSIFYFDTKMEYTYTEIRKRNSRSEETVKAVQSALKCYHSFLVQKLNRVESTICFNDYNLNNLREFRNWLQDSQNCVAATVNQRISLIRGFLDYSASIDDSIMVIYLKSKKLAALNVPEHPIEYYTEEQMKELLDAPDRTKKKGRRDSTILSLEYEVALRIGEIPLIIVGDLQLKGKRPQILVHGKGGTLLPVPLTDKMVKRLQEYLEEFHPDSDSVQPLFYGFYKKQKEAISIDTIENIISESVKKCIAANVNMPEANHSHMIRKSRAMHLYQRKVPLTHIQQLLRHKHLDTTSGFYAFATYETLKASIEEADKSREEGREKQWLDPEIRKRLDEIAR